MKPFNLHSALIGSAVVTRDGRTVTHIKEIHSFPKTREDVDEYCDKPEYNRGLLATIHNITGQHEHPYWHDGVAHKYGGETDADLFMKD